MRRALLLLLVVAHAAIAQQRRIFCQYQDQPLAGVLDDLASKFDVRYSFADQTISGKFFSLDAGVFGLADIHEEISLQTGLRITKIDERYYALSQPGMPMEQLHEIVVENYLSRGILKAGGATVLSPEKIEELPGVTDADVLFSLQQLPGIKSPYETATGLYVRGGTPDQNLVLWDGIRMYHPGHLFGMVSPFNPAATGRVIVSDHATTARYGERISATIDMHMADSLPASRFEAGVNGLNLDAMTKLKINGRADLIVAARKSFTGQWRSPTFAAYSRKVFQHTGFNDVDDRHFGFRDVVARFNFRPTKKSSFHITGILVDNDLDFSAMDSLQRKNVRVMDIRNVGASGFWSWQPSHKWRVETQADYSLYDFFYESDLLPGTSDRSSFVKKNRVVDSGAGIVVCREFSAAASVSLGYRFQGNDLSHVFKNGTAIADVLLDQRHIYNVFHTGFAEIGTGLFGGRAVVGGRYTHYGVGKDQVEPRISFERKLRSTVTARLSFERKSQAVSQIREAVTNDLSLENYLWVLADGKTYPVLRAEQTAIGLTWKKAGWLADAAAYIKSATGLTSRSFGFLRLSDTIVHTGGSRAKGMEFLLQRTGTSWRGSLTYSLQDIQNRYDGFNGGREFPASSDIRHAVAVSAFKKWGNFTFSAGWFWHSGKPFSEVRDGAIYAYNNARLAPYHRLDISAAYSVKGRRWKGKAGLSILNVYGRSSVISREFEREYQGIADFDGNRYVVRDYRSLGFTPNVFFRVAF